MSSPSDVFVVPLSPSPNLLCTLNYVELMNSTPWSVEKITSCFTDDLEHHILPKSLGSLPMNRSQYAKFLQAQRPIFAQFKAILHEVIETGNAMTVHVSSTGLSTSGVPYSNEYMFILHFREAAEPGQLPKICSMKEFVDSQTTAKFFSKVDKESKNRSGGGRKAYAKL